jgi:hypothetical protein
MWGYYGVKMPHAVDVCCYLQYASSLDKNLICIDSQTKPKISLAPIPHFRLKQLCFKIFGCKVVGKGGTGDGGGERLDIYDRLVSSGATTIHHVRIMN